MKIEIGVERRKSRKMLKKKYDGIRANAYTQISQMDRGKSEQKRIGKNQNATRPKNRTKCKC